MTVYSGTAGAVADSDGDYGGIKNWSIDDAASELEASNFGQTWRLTDSGVKEWSGSFEGDFDNSDPGQTRLWQYFLDGTTFSLRCYIDRDLASVFTGNVRLTGHSPSQSHDGLGSGTWTFKGDGALDTVRP